MSDSKIDKIVRVNRSECNALSVEERKRLLKAAQRKVRGKACKHEWAATTKPMTNKFQNVPYQWVVCVKCGREMVEQPPKTKDTFEAIS